MDENEQFSSEWAQPDPELEPSSTEAPQKLGRLRAAGSAFAHWTRETTFVIVMALALSVLLRTFVFQAFYVPSSSMEETLLINDRIIASKLSYRFGDIHRGDVIVFQDPGGWLPEPLPETGMRARINEVLKFIGVLPQNSGKDLVKRVIGVEGDHIKCCTTQGQLEINGVAVNENAYAQSGTDSVAFELTVPAGRVFVMGDNRNHSSDSRAHMDVAHGTVPVENIVGQVVSLIWPFDRFGRVDTSEVLANVPYAK